MYFWIVGRPSTTIAPAGGTTTHEPVPYYIRYAFWIVGPNLHLAAKLNLVADTYPWWNRSLPNRSASGPRHVLSVLGELGVGDTSLRLRTDGKARRWRRCARDPPSRKKEKKEKKTP